METKSKMATKTKTKTKTDEAPREHKKPWQETFATPEEIKAMVSNHVLLRYNEVRGLTEVHWLSEGPVIQEDEQGEFIPVALAMQIVSANISQKISKEAMGHAFIDLGFERKTFRNVRGYVAVRRSQQEIDLMRKGLAIATDNDTHTLDTPFF